MKPQRSIIVLNGPFLLLQAFLAEAMLIMATVIHLGKSGLPTKVTETFIFLSLLRSDVSMSSDFVAVSFCLNRVFITYLYFLYSFMVIDYSLVSASDFQSGSCVFDAHVPGCST